MSTAEGLDLVREVELANVLLAEEGFYLLRDKRRTTEQVHGLAKTVIDLADRLEEAERRLSAHVHANVDLNTRLMLSADAHDVTPDVVIRELRSRLERAESKLTASEHARLDDADKIAQLVQQRQDEWGRAEMLRTTLAEMTSREMSIDEMRQLAVAALRMSKQD